MDEESPDVRGENLTLWKETAYKRFFREPGSPVLTIELKGSSTNPRWVITQEELNRWLKTMKGIFEEHKVSDYFPSFEGEDEPSEQPRFREEFIEGEELGENEFGYDSHIAQLNDLIRKCIPMIEAFGFVPDIRQENIIVNPDGNIKMVDLFPVISKTADRFSLIARDPYEFLLKKLVGVLSSSNLHALAQRAGISEQAKEYWSILAQERRLKERDDESREREYTHDELIGIAKDIADILKESPNVRLAGVYGSLARGSKRVGDIDLFTVVDKETFKKIVDANKQALFKRKYIKMIFYTRLEQVSRFFNLPQEKERKIAEKRKITLGDMDKIVQAHLLALPEDITDPEIQDDLQWVMQHQPDANFFYNVMYDAIITSVPEQKDYDDYHLMGDNGPWNLSLVLGEEYWETVNRLAEEEVARREGIKEKFEKENHGEI